MQVREGLFYTYPAGVPALKCQEYARPSTDARTEIHGAGAAGEALAAAAAKAGLPFNPVSASAWNGIAIGRRQLRLTDGWPAWQVARDECLQDVAVFDERSRANWRAAGVAA